MEVTQLVLISLKWSVTTATRWDIFQESADSQETKTAGARIKIALERLSRNQDSSRKTVIVEDTSPKAMVAIDGVGFDWSYMADDEVPTNMALMDFSDSK
nr:hypothetical protein [Tanacetum cinerariifolium]